MNLSDTQAFLNSVMRTIDRKMTVTIEPSANTDRSGIMVRMVRDRRVGFLDVSNTDLLAAQADAMHRSRLRTALKRVHDGLWYTSTHIFNTKMERSKPEGGDHYRSNGRGRR